MAALPVSARPNQGMRYRLNQIDGNAGLGIDLGNDGITDNDLGSPDPPVLPDADSGPNDFQNTGELSAAVIDLSDNALNVDGNIYLDAQHDVRC